MTSLRGLKTRTDRRGFTLLEVSLTLGLMVLLAGVSVYGFTGWQRTAPLNEGHKRFATLLRAARVEASSVGKRLRLSFDAADDADEGAGFEVLWEPDPLGAAGEFVPYGGLFTRSYAPDTLVRVRRCRLTGDSAFQTLMFASAEDDPDLQDVTFYPDGSSDSAQVVLMSTHSSDHRGVVIEMNGLTGTMQVDVMLESEMDEWLDENE